MPQREVPRVFLSQTGVHVSALKVEEAPQCERKSHCLSCEKKSHEKNLLLKMKAINTTASRRVCCWIGVFSTLFILLARSPSLHPMERKYDTPDIAASLYRESVDHCRGRRVYMYDLPPEFNVGVKIESKCNKFLIGWIDLCPRFSNDGYGVQLWNDSQSVLRKGSGNGDEDFALTNWHDTDSYMLEMIFHARLPKYRCLTKDPAQANAFFVPYYTGLLALKHFYNQTAKDGSFEERKNFGRDLVDWLEENGGEAWSRFHGKDHFIIAGRVAWDFFLLPPYKWGTGFNELPYIANMTTLMLESDTYVPNEIAVPYPTAFHPKSPQKLQSWIEKVEQYKRRFLFSYVGAPRPWAQMSVRDRIGKACLDAGDEVCTLVNCSAVKCSHDPVTIYKAFLSADFCLQPKGDTATRRSTFDCLISGSIPVFFDNDSAYTQYIWHLPQDRKSYSVYISEEDVKKGVSIPSILRSYSPKRLREMRRNIISFIPNLLYNGYDNDPSSLSKDAFEISLERVLEKVSAVRKEHSAIS